MRTSRSTRLLTACKAIVASGCFLMIAVDTVHCGEEPTVDFDRQIRPILADKCYACHGPDESSREGGFRIDQKESAVAEADSGSPPIVPGDAMSSEVYVRLITDDEDLLMPPEDSGKTLSPAEIKLVQDWIDQGAVWKQHWAFVAPKRPLPPTVKHKNWLKTPIDLFVLQRLESERLTPSPQADKRTLIRRVTFDLTGLPPSAKDVQAYLSDESVDAYERVVDRLLESGRYGEHMARFWLDAARYSDTHGLHLDNYREIWPYRDWVIRAFNENLRFDQFTIKQLAGDLLPDPTVDDLVATGFNRCHVTTNEGGSIKEEVYVRNVVDRVVTTGTVFMGMTLECSRCHDHKYDPVTMRDVYSMFAFFNSLDGDAMDGNKARHAPIVELPTPEQAEERERLNTAIAGVKKKISDAVASIDMNELDASDDENEPASEAKQTRPKHSIADWIRDQRQSPTKGVPKKIVNAIKADDHTEAQQTRLRDYFVEHVFAPARETFAPLHKDLKQLESERKRLTEQIPATLVYKELDPPRPSFVLHRGEYDQRRDEVTRAVPTILPQLPDGAPLNRLGLAQWLVSRDHPLTARVTVNRLWQQVFGTGIVKTSEDFGSQGEPPSHPELLDWLAVQFQEDGWDVKAMMKRFVMSATYRQSSRITPELARRDPTNRLLGRAPRYRLDAEMLRDQALAVSGLLVDKIGGPSVKPPQPAGLWSAVGYSGSNTVRFKADKAPFKIHRRALYTFIKRTAAPPQMSTFDAPSREYCTVRRERTNTPLQALLLLNDPQQMEAARAIAKTIAAKCDSCVEDRVAQMFEQCTARPPDSSETRELVNLYEDHLTKFTTDSEAAAKLLGRNPDAQGSSATNVNEIAAWTMVANLVLNLDEVINKN